MYSNISNNDCFKRTVYYYNTGCSWLDDTLATGFSFSNVNIGKLSLCFVIINELFWGFLSVGQSITLKSVKKIKKIDWLIFNLIISCNPKEVKYRANGQNTRTIHQTVFYHLRGVKGSHSDRRTSLSWAEENEDSKNKSSSTKWAEAKWCMWKQREKQWSETDWIIDERWALWFWNSTGKRAGERDSIPS